MCKYIRLYIVVYVSENFVAFIATRGLLNADKVKKYREYSKKTTTKYKA